MKNLPIIIPYLNNSKEEIDNTLRSVKKLNEINDN